MNTSNFDMEEFIKLGRDLGLEGDQLLQFTEKRQAEAFEREERNKDRGLKRLELEAEAFEHEERNKDRGLKRLELEAEAFEHEERNKDRGLKRLELEAEAFEHEERNKDRGLKRLELEAEAFEHEERNKDRGFKWFELEAEAFKRGERNKDRELKRIELAAEQEHFKEADKRRAHELEMKSLELSAAETKDLGSSADEAARAPKLPSFNENSDEMDAYLERSERFSKDNNWQEAAWAVRLSALLTGNSLEFFSRLPKEEADDHRELKLALLRHYDYTDDGYRRKLRNCKPEEGETRDLFIERIKSYLEKCLATAGLNEDYADIQDLIQKERLSQRINCPP
ncbi:hypothetical protein RRG08_058908 [Elysia crispata]|uniref:Uncharacterized protein n=1 Tax=Elysia crispata TaxID=231223 RepID=A0AAE1DEZ7_9GAST|nr:hypothetical protein RRG08_058908 [Elysia crispata]